MRGSVVARDAGPFVQPDYLSTTNTGDPDSNVNVVSHQQIAAIDDDADRALPVHKGSAVGRLVSYSDRHTGVLTVAAICVTPILYLIFILHFTSDGLLCDWRMVPFLHSALHGHLSWGQLWSQYGEPRLPLVRLDLLIVAKATQFGHPLVDPLQCRRAHRLLRALAEALPGSISLEGASLRSPCWLSERSGSAWRTPRPRFWPSRWVGTLSYFRFHRDAVLTVDTSAWAECLVARGHDSALIATLVRSKVL